MKRKLQQLADRREKKEARAGVYATLEANALDEREFKIMSSSSKLGHKMTKRERLKHYLELERAGIELTAAQKDELYETGPEVDDAEMEEVRTNVRSFSFHIRGLARRADTTNTLPSQMAAAADAKMKAEAEARIAETGTPAPRLSKKKRKQARKEKLAAKGGDAEKKEEWVGIWEDKSDGGEPDSAAPPSPPPAPAVAPPAPAPAPASVDTPNPSLSFAEQMMQQLSSLKKKTEEEKVRSITDTSVRKDVTANAAVSFARHSPSSSSRRRRRRSSPPRRRRRG